MWRILRVRGKVVLKSSKQVEHPTPNETVETNPMTTCVRRFAAILLERRQQFIPEEISSTIETTMISK